jgi:hypothetical protein
MTTYSGNQAGTTTSQTHSHTHSHSHPHSPLASPAHQHGLHPNADNSKLFRSQDQQDPRGAPKPGALIRKINSTAYTSTTVRTLRRRMKLNFATPFPSTAQTHSPCAVPITHTQSKTQPICPYTYTQQYSYPAARTQHLHTPVHHCCLLCRVEPV